MLKVKYVLLRMNLILIRVKYIMLKVNQISLKIKYISYGVIPNVLSNYFSVLIVPYNTHTVYQNAKRVHLNLHRSKTLM